MPTIKVHGITYKNAGFDFDITTEQLQEDHDIKMSIWQSSACRKDFLDIIDRNRPIGGWRFDKMVFIAGGTFIDLGTAGSCMFQVACVMDTANELMKRGHAGASEIQIFAHDPIYFRQDLELLSQKGATVLEGRRLGVGMEKAKEHTGPNTLPFEFYCDISEEMCKNLCEAETGMYIGTGTEWMRGHVEDDVSETIDDFDEKHESCAFPSFEAGKGAFGGLMIHWRRTLPSRPGW